MGHRLLAVPRDDIRDEPTTWNRLAVKQCFPRFDSVSHMRMWATGERRCR